MFGVGPGRKVVAFIRSLRYPFRAILFEPLGCGFGIESTDCVTSRTSIVSSFERYSVSLASPLNLALVVHL